MPSYKTEGVVLKRWNYGEADRILTLYTKHYGKIRAVAKGVRRLTSRKAGALELFNQVILFLAQGKSLDIITQAEAVAVFSEWRTNLNRVGVAYYFCELVDKLTPEQQPTPLVYELLTESLAKLATENLEELVLTFQAKLLRILGFGLPDDLPKTVRSVQAFIEEISEKKMKTPEVIRKI